MPSLRRTILCLGMIAGCAGNAPPPEADSPRASASPLTCTVQIDVADGPGGDGQWLTRGDDFFVKSVVFFVNGYPIASTIHTDAGKDRAWNTPDDIVRYSLLTTHPATGLLEQFAGVADRGADNILGTADDLVDVVGRWDIDANGLVRRAMVFKGQPGQSVRAEPSFLNSIVQFGYEDGLLSSRRSITSPGADGQWFTLDDQPETIQEFVRDDSKLLYTSVIPHPGAEPSQYTRHAYDANGLASSRVHFSPGDDGEWFTEDDDLGPLYVFERTPDGRLRRETLTYGSAFSSRHLEYDSAGRLYRETIFKGMGQDGVPGTDDDSIGSLTTYQYSCTQPVSLPDTAYEPLPY